MATKKVVIKQSVDLPSRAGVDRLGGLLVLCGGEPGLLRLPYGEVLAARRPGKQLFTTDLPNDAGTRVSVAQPDPKANAFDLLTLGRKLAAQQIECDPKEIGVAVAGLPADLAARAAEAVVAALLAAVHPLPAFKRRPAPERQLRTIRLFGLDRRLDLSRTMAEAEGNDLARALTALPANRLTPRLYRERVASLAREEGWTMRLYDLTALRRMGAGAFLAVTQGSGEPDAAIVHLRYEPDRGGDRKALSLVGKGVCFDTGGTNLKSARHMHGMHQDMAGSAVALGMLLALTRLKAPFPVDCWLALAQNQIGPKAYRQGDLVTALDGTTIEVVHTDAEGRMILADTLTLASRAKPALIIDYATLTGSCIQALGTAYSGACTNRDDFVPAIIEAGRASGERVWPFPMDSDFDTALESELADIRQCTLESEADHILGARFLSRFVGGVPWLHLDLASAAHKGGLAHIPTEVTGFGLRFTSHFLEQTIPAAALQGRVKL